MEQPQGVSCSLDLPRNKLLPPRGAHILQLLPDVLVKIFQKLSTQDKFRVAQVCKTWRAAVYLPILWPLLVAEVSLRGSREITSTLISSLNKRAVRMVKVTALSRHWLRHRETGPRSRHWLGDLMDGIPNLISLNLHWCGEVNDKTLFCAFSKERSLLQRLIMSNCSDFTNESVKLFTMKLKNLSSLSLKGCPQVTDMSLLLIARGLLNLKIIFLSKSEITDVGIGHLAGVGENETLGYCQLTSLSVRHSQQLTDLSLMHLSQGQTKLEKLHLAYCDSVTSSGCKYLQHMTKLNDIVLQGDHCGSSLSYQLTVDETLIKQLHVWIANLIGRGKIIIGNMIQLNTNSYDIPSTGERRRVGSTSLFIKKCKGITDKGLFEVARLRCLQQLDLLGIEISNEGLRHIVAGGSQIAYLNLTGCTLIQSQALHIISCGLFSLWGLTLDRNHVNDVGLDLAARTLTKLTSLLISGIEMIGEIAEHRKLLGHPSTIDSSSGCGLLDMEQQQKIISCDQPKKDPVLNRVSNIFHLPPEILLNIFKYFSVQDKGRAAQVCIAWRDMAYEHVLWRHERVTVSLDEKVITLSMPGLAKRGLCQFKVTAISGHRLRGLMDGFPTLTYLDLNKCKGVDDKTLSRAFSKERIFLLHLNLRKCRNITDISVQLLTLNCNSLVFLSLFSCSKLTDRSLLLISRRLLNLKELLLGSNELVTDEGIGYLAGVDRYKSERYCQLKVLSLYNFDRLNDQSLKHLSEGQTNLEKLDIQYLDRITVAGFTDLSKMAKLTCLTLSGNNFGDDVVLKLSLGPAVIKTIVMSYNSSISDGGLSIIGKMIRLSILVLHECPEITDAGLYNMAKQRSGIETLRIYSCSRITNEGLVHVVKLPFLTTLELIGVNINNEGLYNLVYGKSKITYLVLSECIGVGPQALQIIASGLFSMQNLVLDKNHVNDAGMALAARTLTELSIFWCGNEHLIDEIAYIRNTLF